MANGEVRLRVPLIQVTRTIISSELADPRTPQVATKVLVWVQRDVTVTLSSHHARPSKRSTHVRGFETTVQVLVLLCRRSAVVHVITPGCGEPVVRLVEGEYYINYETAHIRGVKEKGARHDRNMSHDERKDFTNLILLCLVHHKHVDRIHRDKYPPEILLQWKADREADGQDASPGLLG